MADQELTAYIDALTQALLIRKDWLEQTELPKLKEELRTYQSSYSSLYNIYLKKKLINEDPYKQETKLSEITIPETSAFNEAKRLEQLSIRLSNYDSQLDFLVNFYQFSVDFLNLERIKRIIALVRYIDWLHLTPDSQSVNTKAVSEITQQSKTGVDQITLSVIGESLTRLSKTTAAVMGGLKELTNYHKECYKLDVRSSVTKEMSASEAAAPNIKKKIASDMPGTPFYQEIIEELIKEDYSSDAPALREAVLNSLRVADEKPKDVKPTVNYKATLLEGIQVIGGVGAILAEIAPKLDENEMVLANQRKSFWEKLRQALKQMMHNEPDEIFYEVQYMDATKGVPVKEKLNFRRFREDMDKKTKVMTNLTSSAAAAKLSAMTEDQIITYLERTIRDAQILHRTLSALDDFFKREIPKEDREKVHGFRPELASIKNCIVRANQLRHEYSAQKEEEEQMKRLGVTPTA